MSDQLRLPRERQVRRVRDEQGERELIHRLDILTDALDQIRVRGGHRLGGLVRWALPIIEGRNRIADELALRRAR